MSHENSRVDDIMGQLTKITILGSTGSIGVSTLDVVGRHPEKYQVFALVAGANVELLSHQIQRFRPQVAVVATDAVRESLIHRLDAMGMAQSERPALEFGAR